MGSLSGKCVKEYPARERDWSLLISTAKLFEYPPSDDCSPFTRQDASDFLTLDFFGFKYKAKAESFDLNPSVLAQTLVKYVYMHGLKPLKLERDFFNRTETQKLEIEETLCKLYWNGDPRFQEGFMEHLTRHEARRDSSIEYPPSKDVQKLLLRKFSASKYSMYHFMLTEDEVKPLTAAVIRKVWDTLDFNGKPALPSVIDRFANAYFRGIEEDINLQHELWIWCRPLRFPRNLEEWIRRTSLLRL